MRMIERASVGVGVLVYVDVMDGVIFPALKMDG
jgi:hypothetical protein